MYWHILSTNRFNAETWAPPPPLRCIHGEWGRQKSTIFLYNRNCLRTSVVYIVYPLLVANMR